MLLNKTSVTLLLSVFGLVNSLPKNLKQCKLDDNACIIEVANEIFKNRYQGIGELGLSSIDPLKIDKMDLVQGGNVPVQIDLKFRKVVLLGLSKAKLYKISGFRADPENNKLEIRFKTPLGTLVGPYVINGKMLILPIRGNGNVTLNLENLDIHLKFLTKKVMKDGKAFMKIEKSKFYYEVSGANINFTNLFNGDKILGDNMNLFLNANWMLLLDELKKPISVSFAKVFKEALNSVFDETPYEELFAQ